MDALYSLDELREAAPLFDASAVAVGNFDGVHLGHARVLERAVQRARKAAVAAVVLTFHPHPRAVVGSGPPPGLASRRRQRLLLEASGVDATVTLRFDDRVAALSPEQFVDQVLVGGLRARHVVVGNDFRFGHKARGTAASLARLGRDRGFDVIGVQEVRSGNLVVSSTEIRRALHAGDVEAAAGLLGRPFEVRGRVVSGAGRGTGLGYPTANVEPEAGLLLPGSGVYGAKVLGGPALAVVGTRPTFGETETVLEVHLLDFEGDLRGRELDVVFLRRLRDVATFPSPTALQRQMAADEAEIRGLFSAAESDATG